MVSASSRLDFVFAGKVSACIQPPREVNTQLHPTGTHQLGRDPLADTVCYNGVNSAHHLPAEVQAEKGERDCSTRS